MYLAALVSRGPAWYIITNLTMPSAPFSGIDSKAAVTALSNSEQRVIFLVNDKSSVSRNNIIDIRSRVSSANLQCD